MGPATFRRWLEQEFEWSAALASNHMRVAEKFGDLDCLGQFQPSALYVLARRRVDGRAVARAVALVRRGRRVTQRLAKALIAKFESPDKKSPRSRSLQQLQRLVDQVGAQVSELSDRADPAQLKAVPAQLEQLAKTLRRRSTTKTRARGTEIRGAARAASPSRKGRASVPAVQKRQSQRASRPTAANGRQHPAQGRSRTRSKIYQANSPPPPPRTGARNGTAASGSSSPAARNTVRRE